MTYITIPIIIFIIVFAIYKQKSFKGKMEGVSFYGEESLQITRTIIPDKEEITFISCGTNRATETKAMFKASARSHITNTTSGDFKHFDYYIVAKTVSQIYFIPVKIVGKWKLTLQLNSKMKTKVYPIENLQQEIVKHKPNATLPSIDIKFTANSDSSHLVQFYDGFGEFEELLK